MEYSTVTVLAFIITSYRVEYSIVVVVAGNTTIVCKTDVCTTIVCKMNVCYV
jgi:hypothetical protein